MPGGAGDAVDLLLGELVARLLAQRAGERGEGRIEVARRVLVQRRDLVEQLDPAGRLLAATDLDLVSGDELLPVTDLAVERLEQVRDGQLVASVLAETLESGEGLRVVRIALEHRAVALDGRVDHVHLGLAQLREAEHQAELLLVRRGERELRLEVVGQLAPHLLAREERVEGRQSPLARRIELEDLAVVRDRVGRLAQACVGDLRHLHVERLAGGGVRRSAPPASPPPR